MELYNLTSYEVSRLITQRYSTSFSGSIKLFSQEIQPHIYAIYGLTRIADEIVDTYRGKDAKSLLEDLESEVYAAIKRGYSANPVVAAFAVTAREFKIGRILLRPFFASMAMDLEPTTYTDRHYKEYIHGSAEVVGLMCLRVFIGGEDKEYTRLKDSASALGAAYQKINFLRDFAADYRELGRVYFPGVSFEDFNDSVKNDIVCDIEKDLKMADEGLRQLPASSQRAVSLSILYYGRLLKKLKNTTAEEIKRRRVRLSSVAKLGLMLSNALGARQNV